MKGINIPRTAPANTSNGVCPINSFNSFCTFVVSPRSRSRIMRFKIFACSPAARLTPAASYMTINAKITLMAKIAESNPYCLPVDVASAQTVAECELGIPPADNKKVKLNRFSFQIPKNNFKICANTHPSTA